jgi:dipeptidyl aminopeptidase/acylaminoacyl peptidase
MGPAVRRAATLVAASLLSLALTAPTAGTGAAARRPDFARMRQEQAQTDRVWRAASAGHMRMEKIAYRSRAGDLQIPAFVFQPLAAAREKTQPALVWVHEDVRGHLYEHYIPFIRGAVERGYVVIAPEYRGSIGYGATLYDAIDYGGKEVDDVVSAVDVLKARYDAVDPDRIGIIGWSHGGLIALLSVFRNPRTFHAAAAMVPVTNLFQRLAWKGVDRQRAIIDPANRLGGRPAERRQVYKARSPVYQVDKLCIPLLVHVVGNDQDVNIEESMQLIDALRARKPALAETKIYPTAPGGHTFDRRVDESTWEPVNTPEQRDSWERIWDFFERHLGATDR